MGLEYQRNERQEAHFVRLFDKYSLLALNIFKWDNLPNGMQSRNIEKALFHNGQATFFKHKDIGLVCLPSSNGGRPNVYNESKTAIATGFGSSFTEIVDIENCVDTLYSDVDNEEYTTGIRIMNNDLMTPSINYVSDYSEKMFEVELAINLNVEQQKFPYIVETNTNTELTLKKMFSSIKQGNPAIFVNKNMSLDTLRVFDLNVPFVVDKLNSYKFELEREILTFFGLNNNYEKKERLLVDEVNSNNDYISRNVELMYKCRKEACEAINKKYGLNVTVEKVDLFHQVDETEETMITNLKNPRGGVNIVQNE